MLEIYKKSKQKNAEGKDSNTMRLRLIRDNCITNFTNGMDTLLISIFEL